MKDKKLFKTFVLLLGSIGQELVIHFLLPSGKEHQRHLPFISVERK